MLDQTPLKEWLDGMNPPALPQGGMEVQPTGPDAMLIAPGERAQRIGTVLRDGHDEIRWLRVNC
ncbi:hypothetical protein AXW67_28965 [Bradyrhizobium neotropicale]|uniref:Uncharacterized protein n=1 Tax=Bradyrhizobium neotropicale TaxID=1497615 RepID=A0A176YPD6_9BRAD|nr:hypothetical protein AXW67_28965 [Bradyrhizobium neotropicale]